MRSAARLAVLLVLAAVPGAARAGEAAVAVTAGQSPRLIRFDTDAPGTVLAAAPVGGLTAGETLVALDVRPLTGQLFALTDTGRVLILDLASGQATQLGPVIAGTTPRIGFDFDPTADRLRFAQSDEPNFRFDPVTAVVDGDESITYAGDVNAGDDPDVVASAYDRNDTDGTTPTTLFAIEENNDVLVRQGSVDGTPDSPSLGALTTIGGLGLDLEDAALDIASPLGGPDAAYLAAAGGLLRVDLATGTPTPIGPTGDALSGFAILPGGALRVAGATVVESAPSAVVSVSRSGDSLAATSVDYATADGSATAGTDYTATAGTLTFERGRRTRDITVPLLGDAAVEGEEAFAVTLSEVGPGAALDAPAAVVRLTDDDAAPSPAPTVTPTDDVEPVLLVLPSAPKSLRALRRSGRMRVAFGCSEACRTALTLNLGARRLGTGERTLQDAGAGRITVRLTKAGKRALARVKGRRATLTLTGLAADRNNNRTTTTDRLRVRRVA